MTVTGAVLKRDAPLPTCWMRGRAREGQEGTGALGRDGERAIAGKPVAPILERHAERVAEQQAAEARAVDEQIAADAAIIVELERGDVSGFAVLLDPDDATFDPLRTQFFGMDAQILAVSGGVEVEGVGKLRAECAKRCFAAAAPDIE